MRTRVSLPARTCGRGPSGPPSHARWRLARLAVALVLATGVLVVLPAASAADTLETTELQVTSTTSVYETTPVLGADSYSNLVVYTSRALLSTGFDAGDVFVQRISDDALIASPTLVSDGSRDNMMNDVHGRWVAFTSYESLNSDLGQIRVFDISTEVTTTVSDVTLVNEARIFNGKVAWIEGPVGYTYVLLKELFVDPYPTFLGGGATPAFNVEIGDNFVVWDEFRGYQYDLYAYDLRTEETFVVANDPVAYERYASTTGSWIVYERKVPNIAGNAIIAKNIDSGEEVVVVDNEFANYAPTADGDLIAYESRITGNFDVFVYRLSDGATFQITDDPEDQRLNNLYGQQVAYIDGRNGNWDIFVTSFDFIPEDPCLNLGGDADADGVCDQQDNCLGLVNPDQADADGDGLGDPCDNCPDVSNISQLDADGDGWGAACECDDMHATVYPGAPEICDGLDNDCDGVLRADETDDDSDGYVEGDFAAWQGSSAVIGGGDCDDADPTRHPGALELCDGIDNDCNGLVDDVPNAPPVADAGGPYVVDEGAPVPLDGSGSVDPNEECGDEIVKYEWDLDDDGEFDDAEGAQPDPATIEHYWIDSFFDVSLSLRVTDTFGATDIDQTTITALNVAPDLVAISDIAVAEGETFDLDATFTDPGVLDSQAALVDWGDGESGSAVVTKPPGTTTGSVTASHAYADDGEYTVTVTVSDDDGGTDTETFTAHVANVAPIVEDFGPGSDPFEGHVANATATFSDPGVLDIHSATINWGDGTPTAIATLIEPNSPDGSIEATHTYADNGTYVVTLTVADEDGGVTTCDAGVTVDNVAPVVTAEPDKEADEGEIIPINPSFVDPGILDTHTGTVDWGDGSAIKVVKVTEPNSPAGSLEATHAYADNGTYVVTVTVEDNDGGVGVDTMQVTVSNVAPSVTVEVDPGRHVWGVEIPMLGTVSDPGVADTHEYLWDFGDAATQSGGPAMTHAYDAPGSYSGGLSVTDDDGGVGSAAFAVEVDKRATHLALDPLSDTSATCGEPAFLAATLTDELGTPVLGADVTFALGTQSAVATTDLLGHAGTVIVVDQPAGSVALSVSFAGGSRYGDSWIDSFFDVVCGPTTLAYEGDLIVERYHDARFAARLTSASGGEGLAGRTVTFTVSDGVSTETHTAVTNATGLAEVMEQVAVPTGVYTLTAQFAGDGPFEPSSAAVPFTVWEALPGLKATGGGWIDNNGSKLTFGFTAQYTSTSGGLPIGEFQMIDHATKRKFKAEGFDWLIITYDGVAILRGSVTVDGSPGHSFQMVARDNGTPGGGVDTFEITIDGMSYASGVLEGGNIKAN